MKTFAPEALAAALTKEVPAIAFAYLFGSASNGEIKEGADVDIAVYRYSQSDKYDTLMEIYGVVEPFVGDTRIDLVFLNKADSILAFEALSGRKLLLRPEAVDLHAWFYSLTCREYESDIFWMKKQLIYRGYEVQWDH